MMKVSDDYKILSRIFTDWWRVLHKLDANGKAIVVGPNRVPLPPDRKSLAELRRINVIDIGGHALVEVDAALAVPSFRKLISEARSAKLNDILLSRWLDLDTPTLEPFAIAAATLARIRKDTDVNAKCGVTARLLGGDEPIFAEPRFKRLMRSSDDWPDLLAQARRVGAILQREAPVGDLGASLVLWNADPSIRTRWAFNYYQGELEPEADSTASPAESTPSAPPA